MRLSYFVDVKTENPKDWKICWITRLTLIDTERFLGCRDRHSLRLRNFFDVGTKVH